MKDLTKKGVIAACSLALLGLAAGQAQALSITVTQINKTQAAVDDKIGGGTILENFDDITGTTAPVGDVTDPANGTRWYQSLSTNVGTFTVGDGSLAGQGSSSYGAKTGGAGTYFELRDYDANGRYDVTDVEGDQYTNYLDSADITKLTLNVDGAFNNLFFFVTDPSDIEAMTTTGAVTTNNDANSASLAYKKDDSALWFVEISANPGDTIASITWTTTLGSPDGPGSTNDGFGIDNIGTKPVPEPTTALLLGAGLLPLVGLRRRSKK